MILFLVRIASSVPTARKIVILLLLLTAVSCNRTRYSYFDKKQACSRFLTDKQLRENTFGDAGQRLTALPTLPTPVVFYSTSLDTCVAVVKAGMTGEVTMNGVKTQAVGAGATFDLLTGMELEGTSFDTANKDDFTHYESDMMKRYEAAQ